MVNSRRDPSTVAIVLSAGSGTRRNAHLGLLLQELCGRPMIHYAVDSAVRAGVGHVVVVLGGSAGEVADYLHVTFGESVRVVIQRGGGDPVPVVRRALARVARLRLAFVLSAECPLVEPAQLVRLRKGLRGPASAAVLTSGEPGSRAGGPVLCELPLVSRVVSALGRRAPERGKALSTAAGDLVEVRDPGASAFVEVRDLVDLVHAEELLYARIADGLRRGGVVVRGGARIDADVNVEAPAVIETGVRLRGKTHIGRGARVDVGAVLTDVVVAPGAVVKAYSVCARVTIGERAEVGPLCHLRQDTEVGADARIGNFVEAKNVVVGPRAMANHLAYMGDGELGEGANIGAGTIFCNSDGFNKHRTVVGAGAFVGSDCQLVAPVHVGAGAYVATGTTVTQDVPDNALAIARVRQQNKPGYAIRLRARFKAQKTGAGR
jgi:bifunctional UDP-N-acetylglucosamine pyrophosphorylase/glucosamine-1-phosphate N-acetyltransferase